jgi:hypothetical protein
MEQNTPSSLCALSFFDNSKSFFFSNQFGDKTVLDEGNKLPSMVKDY